MLNVVTLPLSHGQFPGKRAIILRTSDRIQFRQCRRRWGWQSHLKGNLTAYDRPAPLWFGSAFHFALEDYNGYNRFGTPAKAFTAFCYATAQNTKQEIPPEAQELLHLGRDMLNYYTQYWLSTRKNDKTYWENGEPQVEVNFEIPINLDLRYDADRKLWEYMQEQNIDVILYRGTFDRIIEDEYGQLWVGEYKTAKKAEANHFLVDPQITAYIWAASQVYNKPVVGVIYEQFVKKRAVAPKILSNGKVSTSSTLVTSYPLYKERLEQLYGDVEKAPKGNIDFLWELASVESPDKDSYIQRERVYRNMHSGESELIKIKLELEDILNPELPLYPSPTRDCHYRCPFMGACVSLDDGSDWEEELQRNFSDRRDLEEYWRSRLPDISLVEYFERAGFPDLEAINLGMPMPVAKTDEFDFSVVDGTIIPTVSQLPDQFEKGPNEGSQDSIDRFTVDLTEVT